MKRHLSGSWQKTTDYLRSVNWVSKFIDLLIVIIGISVAFQLARWGEADKNDIRRADYLEGFRQENQTNLENLKSALNRAQFLKTNVDTLESLIASSRFTDARIGQLAGGLTTTTLFRPTTLTMELVKQSGDLQLFNNLEFRRAGIDTYATLSRVEEFDENLRDYIDDTIEPFFFSTINYATFRPADEALFSKNLGFTNITISYKMGVSNQLKRYELAVETLKSFDREISKQLAALE